MKTIRCLIVDDEPLAREIIQTHLLRVPGWEVVKTCINAEEAYEALLQAEVDVMFLDIQMPIITGTDFLRSLRNPPLVIFTTAYSEFAVQGFELNATDYLLKPITLNRFFQAVDRVTEKLAVKHQQPLETRQVPASYIFIKHNGKLVKVNFNDILYIKAEKDFSSVYLKDSNMFLSMHLKLLEELLPPNLFYRVHRSFMVNTEKVSSIYGNRILIERHEIPIGANFKEALYKKLNINNSMS
jgi:DNA-binding LytR/AlgR family response regulator